MKICVGKKILWKKKYYCLKYENWFLNVVSHQVTPKHSLSDELYNTLCFLKAEILL